jgi:hypothetical protein
VPFYVIEVVLVGPCISSYELVRSLAPPYPLWLPVWQCDLSLSLGCVPAIVKS